LGGAGGAGGAIDVNALRDNPQIAQLRELIAQNPAMLQPLIQQLANSNPQVAQTIAANPEMLFQLLGAQQQQYEDDGEGPIPPGAHVVSVSEEERAAIERVWLSFYLYSSRGTDDLFCSWKPSDSPGRL
jgi:UV excision repair protein RAD23